MTTPNTLLAAARLAYPEYEWRMVETGNYPRGEKLRENEAHILYGRKITRFFNPANHNDAYALHLALERAGWEFWFAEICTDREANVYEGYYFARFGDDLTETRSRTAEGRYIKCVETLEAMK